MPCYDLDGTDDRFERDFAVAAMPFLCLVWFKTQSTTTAQSLMWTGDKDVATHYHTLRFAGNLASKRIEAGSRAGGASEVAAGTTGGSPQIAGNTWTLAASAFTSATSRTAYRLDGNNATETTSRSPAGTDRFSIGRGGSSTPGAYLNGSVAYAAVYNTTGLSAADITALVAAFYNSGSGTISVPSRSALVAFWAFTSDYSGTGVVPDLSGNGHNLTISGATYDGTDSAPVTYTLATTHSGATTLTATVARTTAAKLTAKAASSATETVGRVTAAKLTAKSSATLTETIAVAVAGTVDSGADTHFGATALTLTVGRVTAGAATIKGAATVSQTVARTTAAKLTAKASTATTEMVGVTTAATRTRFAASSLTETVGAATVGRVTAKSSVSRPEVVTVTTTPEVAGEKFGATTLTETVAVGTSGHVTATGTLSLPAVATVTTTAHIAAYATATLPIVVTITTGEPADFTDVETGYIAFSPHGQLLGPTTGRVVR